MGQNELPIGNQWAKISLNHLLNLRPGIKLPCDTGIYCRVQQDIFDNIISS